MNEVYTNACKLYSIISYKVFAFITSFFSKYFNVTDFHRNSEDEAEERAAKEQRQSYL